MRVAPKEVDLNLLKTIKLTSSFIYLSKLRAVAKVNLSFIYSKLNFIWSAYERFFIA